MLMSSRDWEGSFVPLTKKSLGSIPGEQAGGAVLQQADRCFAGGRH